MSFLILVPRGRTTDFSGSLYEKDGTTPVELAASDRVRAKLGRGNNVTPSLDLVSGTTTANGSTVTIDNLGDATNPAEYTIRFGQADVATLAVGAHDLELDVVDDSETSPVDAIKHVESGVAVVTETMGGAIIK